MKLELKATKVLLLETMSGNPVAVIMNITQKKEARNESIRIHIDLGERR